MPDFMEMHNYQGVIWFAIVFVAGSFFVALSKALTNWMQDRWFKPKRKPNGNGNGGMTHEQAEAMIKALNDNGTKLENGLMAINRGQERMSDVILETDEDGVHKVHNKPSIERLIKRLALKLGVSE